MKKILFNVLIFSVFLASSIQSEATSFKVYQDCDTDLIYGPGVVLKRCYTYQMVWTGSMWWMDVLTEWYEPVNVD
jgi:hypothetical protein